MSSFKIFGWWFMIGSIMALSVIMIQGGIRDIMQMEGPFWNLRLIELITPIIGGGLLGGCTALILNRIRRPEKF